jgi:hypothetical protein
MKFSYGLRLCLLATLLSNCGKSSPWHQEKEKDPETPALPLPPPATSEETAPPIATGDAPDISELDIRNATLSNLEDLLSSTQADKWVKGSSNKCKDMKIAVFDNGFDGLEESKGVRLPPDLSIEKAPVNEPERTPHGTKLAELIWALCTGSVTYTPGQSGPQLKLYNTNGYSNFAAAVESVTTTSPVDIVLYSQVWEFGGNFNGKGFINSMVQQATSKNILWINAAGNFANTAWQGQIQFSLAQGMQARLPFKDKYVRFSVNEPQTPVKITLAWNDFSDAKTYRTNQDLDLIIEDANYKEIAASKLIQDGLDHGKEVGYSSHAREQIKTVLDPGIYFIRVVTDSVVNFKPWSRLRLSGTGKGLVFLDRSIDDTIMIPADNPEVLTIGASDATFSSIGRVTETFQSKPEAMTPSTLKYSNGQSFQGSSTAAAVATALIAIYQNECGRMSKDTWVSAINSGQFGSRVIITTDVTSNDTLVKTIFNLPHNKQCQRPLNRR